MQMSNSHLAWSLLPAGLQVLQGRPPAKKPPTRTDTKLPLLSLPPWETLVRGGGGHVLPPLCRGPYSYTETAAMATTTLQIWLIFRAGHSIPGGRGAPSDCQTGGLLPFHR